jgi:RNA polymerase sigma-70 factor (ECF subfamily)
MDDVGLLERARHGDRDAFTTIVMRYQDQLYTMALRLIGNQWDAADVVQETFLRAYTHLPELRAETVRAWLFRVAINCSRDVQRGAVRRPATSIEDGAGNIVELPDPALGPEASALARERAETITDALAAIPDAFRAALVLRDINDLSYEEISHALRIPLGTVKSRVSRARFMLSHALRASSVFATAREAQH